MKKNKVEQLQEIISKKVARVLEESKKPKKSKVEKDDIGQFWVVTNPKNSSDQENVFACDVFDFSERMKNGLDMSEIKAIVAKENKARQLGERLVKERLGVVTQAKEKAEGLKSLKDEVINKAKNFKKSKQETLKAVKALQEALKPSLKKHK